MQNIPTVKKFNNGCLCNVCKKRRVQFTLLYPHIKRDVCLQCGVKTLLTIISINNDCINIQKQHLKEYHKIVYNIRKMQQENKQVVKQLGAFYD